MIPVGIPRPNHCVCLLRVHEQYLSADTTQMVGKSTRVRLDTFKDINLIGLVLYFLLIPSSDNMQRRLRLALYAMRKLKKTILLKYSAKENDFAPSFLLLPGPSVRLPKRTLNNLVLM